MIGALVMLVGVFVVPAILLWAGHRLRRRSARWRAVFLGTLVGYGIAAVASLTASMMPAEMWQSGDTLRGAVGYWGLLAGPAIGAAAGWISARSG